MREQTIQAILDKKIIAILRGVAPKYLTDLAKALQAGGIGLIEITFDQAKPETWVETQKGIALINETFSGAVLAGAGTVLTPEQVRLAHGGGAKYIISPNADAQVIGLTRELGMVSIPGCMTPTEAQAAHQAGADFIKLLPAGTLGTGYVKALRGPLNHLRYLAVGGVYTDNAAEYLRAGCSGLGIASGLFEPAWLSEGAWDRVTDRAKRFVAAAQA